MKWGVFNYFGLGLMAALILTALVAPFLPATSAAHERWVVVSFGLGVYSLFVLSATAAFAFLLPAKATENLRGRYLRCLQWATRWHGYLFAMVLLGGLMGAVLFVAVGAVLRGMPPWAERLLYGLRDGAMYVGIWAPAIAFVRCVMVAHRAGERRTDRLANEA